LKYLTRALEGLAMYLPHFTLVYISHFCAKLMQQDFLKQFLRAEIAFRDKVKDWSERYFKADLKPI